MSWRTARTANEFKANLAARGYVLARGNRRAFVVIDRTGQVHSLVRRIVGVRSAGLRNRLRGLDLAALPSVPMARKRVREAIHCHATRDIQSDEAPPQKLSAPARRGGFRFRRKRFPVYGRSARIPKRRSRPAKSISAFDVPAIRPWLQARRPLTRRSDIPEAAPGDYEAARSAVLLIYQTKIAAAFLLAPKHQVMALVAALKAEESAALLALRNQAASEDAAKRRNRLAWVMATREIATPDADKSRLRHLPRQRRRRFPRDRRNG
jgi:hypothetical protein